MTDGFAPVLYLKQNCPFCLKVRIFVLETGLAGSVAIRDFAPGTPEEESMKALLSQHLETTTFPAAEIEPGRFITESDAIIAALAERFGRSPSGLVVYRNYVDGPFETMMSLWKENRSLKASAADK